MPPHSPAVPDPSPFVGSSFTSNDRHPLVSSSQTTRQGKEDNLSVAQGADDALTDGDFIVLPLDTPCVREGGGLSGGKPQSLELVGRCSLQRCPLGGWLSALGSGQPPWPLQSHSSLSGLSCGPLWKAERPIFSPQAGH